MLEVINMICPKCGNSLDLFAEKCLSCGKSFRAMSLSERQRLEARPARVPKATPKKKEKRVRRKPEVKTTPIRMTYDNGIPVGEGMSVTGTKQRRGAHRPFLFKY